MSIMLVMPTAQHLHAIFSFLACKCRKMLKLGNAFFESMAENIICYFKDGNHLWKLVKHVHAFLVVRIGLSATVAQECRV